MYVMQVVLKTTYLLNELSKLAQIWFKYDYI